MIWMVLVLYPFVYKEYQFLVINMYVLKNIAKIKKHWDYMFDVKTLVGLYIPFLSTDFWSVP